MQIDKEQLLKDSVNALRGNNRKIAEAVVNMINDTDNVKILDVDYCLADDGEGIIVISIKLVRDMRELISIQYTLQGILVSLGKFIQTIETLIIDDDPITSYRYEDVILKNIIMELINKEEISNKVDEYISKLRK